MRIVFFGSGAIGVPALRALAGAQEVVAVVTQPDRPAGRGLEIRPSPVKEAAGALGIRILEPFKLRDASTIQSLRALGAGLFVVAAYGRILPAEVLEIPSLGCLNIHASLLPRHRGASPVQAAILAGDAETGITIMWVDQGLDTGDILLRRACPILDSDTAGTLHDRLAELAPGAILDAVALVAEGRAPRIPQDPARACYSPKLSKADGRIDWGLPAAEIERRIRALSPWPGCATSLPGGGMLKIHRAAAIQAEGGLPGRVLPADGALRVACAKGALELLEVQAPGSRRMSGRDYLRGHPLPPGVVLGDCPSQQGGHRLE